MSIMVKDVMEKDVPFVKNDAKIRDVIKILVKHNVRFVPVVNEAGLVVGGVSEKDLMKLIRVQPLPTVSAVWQKIQKNIVEKNVTEIMSPRPITINDRAEIADALNLMNASDVYTLIVVDMDYKLLGLVKFRKIIENMIQSS
jgi:predicted transcriptional regulator